MGAHINQDGEFQSDKYPTTPAGKVPLSVKDPTAQDLLWEYAQRRRAVDAEFADDLERALRDKGYVPPEEYDPHAAPAQTYSLHEWVACAQQELSLYLVAWADTNEFHRGRHPWYAWMGAFRNYLSW